MSDIPALLSAAEIAQAVSHRKMTAFAATEAALARIAQHDKVLNAFTDVTADRARAKARAIDAAIAAGQPAGPLAGVPFAVKNLFDVQGLSTRAGSKINRDLPASPRDATLIERMEAAGAVLVGALNMGEYAYDFTQVGVPGLKATVTYLSGDNIDSATGEQKEWERDFRLDYVLQDGALKGLGVSWRNATLRGNTSAADQDENRLILSYSLPIL